MLNINPLWQNIVVGFVLVLAVGLDRVRRARMWRRALR
jgi:ABC-type xylose transport system permease subunit